MGNKIRRYTLHTLLGLLGALVLPGCAQPNLDIVMQQLIPKGRLFQWHHLKDPGLTGTFGLLECGVKSSYWGSGLVPWNAILPICFKCITHMLYFVIERILQCIKNYIYHCTILVQCYLWKRKIKPVQLWYQVLCVFFFNAITNVNDCLKSHN